MNEQRAQQLIVGGLAGTALISGASYLLQDETPPRSWTVGIGGSALGLAVLAMYAPSIAAGLATLLFTTTAFVYGGPVWKAISELTREEVKGGSRK